MKVEPVSHNTVLGVGAYLMRISSFNFVLACCFLLITIVGAKAQPPEVSGYQINWVDEFDGIGLDPNKWEAIFSTSPTNNSLHAYLPNNVFVGGGQLTLLSTDQPFGQFDFRSGQIFSTTRHRFGRFEVRGRLPTSRGMWPAIWLLPDEAQFPWPSQGEIDIMENRGNQPHLTSSAFNYGTNPPFQHFFVFGEQETYIDDNLVNFHDSFHTYAAEWDPEQIRFYVDGVHHYTVRDEAVGRFLTETQTAPMNLIINTAIGGTFLPDPDETTEWPQFFNVDYVYVYDRVGDAVLELDNGGFDDLGGSLSGWTLFGNSTGNVRAVTTPTDSGDGALKLFGQFQAGTNFSGAEQGSSVQAGDEIQVTCRTFIDSADTIAGTSNQVVMNFDFYNANYGGFGSDEYISSQSIVVAESATPNDQWIEHTLTATVPAGAVEARAALVFIQSNFQSGAVFVDSVEFTNLSDVEPLFASEAVINSGELANGNVGDTNESDDQYFEVLAATPSAGQSPIEITFTTNTTVDSPATIELSIESSATSPNLAQTVLAFDYVAQEFVVIDAVEVGTNDTVFASELPGDVSRFVRGSDGQMQVRLRYDAGGPVFMYPWKSRVDSLSWTVGQ